MPHSLVVSRGLRQLYIDGPLRQLYIDRVRRCILDAAYTAHLDFRRPPCAPEPIPGGRVGRTELGVALDANVPVLPPPHPPGVLDLREEREDERTR